ncbi:hypothetical protein PHYPSEUDO_005921 [Phytophthora pseudosyringae]|uniref:Crinkler (CRN) family protein n=1 Tax=Phytophthora pseudosyringae TaxID=221518 RepID=A0A8T1VKD5_9STRA|nr:hypothetical protein PHYPSEUDO_005921 [Phytophthora pseudosyringae]
MQIYQTSAAVISRVFFDKAFSNFPCGLQVMARKWFQLVGEDGHALMSADAVSMDIEDVVAFRDAVKLKYPNALANRAAYNTKQKLPKSSSSVTDLGNNEDDALIVQVPTQRRVDTDEQPPHKKARSSTVIKDENMKYIGHNLNIDAWDVGGIALNICHVESDFPEWFYARKESVDIVKVFKAQMEAKINVVFVGTPGVGKSMLVVLLAFYMALIQKKCVVLFRKQKGKGFSMLYLDAENKRYWRMDEAAISDIDLLEIRDFELCLDGLEFVDVRSHFGTLARFRLLATSVQYPMKNDDTPVLRRCLEPFWSLSDLSAVGAHVQWTEQQIKDRYFYSGGNLRDFLLEREGVRPSEIAVYSASSSAVLQSALGNVQPHTSSCTRTNDGIDATECGAAMKRLASSSDDYWYPSRRFLETIDSVAKLNMGGQSNVVGLIQITKSDHHKIDSMALDKYAAFFPNSSRYISLVPDKKTYDEFRLAPVSPQTTVPLDVAYIRTWCL